MIADKSNARLANEAGLILKFTASKSVINLLTFNFFKGQQDTDVDVSGWSPGIYVAIIYSNGGAR